MAEASFARPVFTPPVPSAQLRQAFAGRRALVTGASAGIGQALALDLAAAGANLVLTARRVDRLEALAAHLRATYRVEVLVVAADLAQPEAPEQLYAATEGAGLSIDVLVNNAGFGYLGSFTASSAAWERKMVEVNCAAVVHLTHLFVPRMVARGSGYILVLASVAGFLPVPYMATYAATKVFDRYFSEALAEELRPHGIRVSALCPGPTTTEFGQVAGARQDFFRRAQTAEAVARKGLLALVKGRSLNLPSFSAHLLAQLPRLLPHETLNRIVARLYRRYAKD